MPKLIIKVFGDPGEEICDLKDAHNFLNFTEQIVVIHGKRARSLNEFLQIVSQSSFEDQEYIEVTQIPAIAGG
jgi:hypothetical protein